MIKTLIYKILTIGSISLLLLLSCSSKPKEQAPKKADISFIGKSDSISVEINLEKQRIDSLKNAIAETADSIELEKKLKEELINK